MSDQDVTSPVIAAGMPGHNSGRTLAEQLLEEARAVTVRFSGRRAEFVTKMNGVKLVRDRIDAGIAADLFGLARRVQKMLDAERANMVAPHDEAVRAVNNAFREFWEPVETAAAALKERVDSYAEEEQGRIRAQEQEQAREEQRRREAAAPAGAAVPLPPAPVGAPAKRRAIRGDYGHQITIGEVDQIDIANWRELPDWVFEAPRVRDAIIAVVKPMIRNKVAVPGTTVTQVVATQARR